MGERESKDRIHRVMKNMFFARGSENGIHKESGCNSASENAKAQEVIAYLVGGEEDGGGGSRPNEGNAEAPVQSSNSLRAAHQWNTQAHQHS